MAERYPSVPSRSGNTSVSVSRSCQARVPARFVERTIAGVDAVLPIDLALGGVIETVRQHFGFGGKNLQHALAIDVLAEALAHDRIRKAQQHTPVQLAAGCVGGDDRDIIEAEQLRDGMRNGFERRCDLLRVQDLIGNPEQPRQQPSVTRRRIQKHHEFACLLMR